MAIANRIASNLSEALMLTPHQIITMSRAVVRMSQPAEARPRRGTPAEFAALMLGAV